MKLSLFNQCKKKPEIFFRFQDPTKTKGQSFLPEQSIKSESKILYLEKLNVGVEEITLGDMNVPEAELVDKCEYSCGDGCLPDRRNRRKGTEGRFVFKHYAV